MSRSRKLRSWDFKNAEEYHLAAIRGDLLKGEYIKLNGKNYGRFIDISWLEGAAWVKTAFPEHNMFTALKTGRGARVCMDIPWWKLLINVIRGWLS